MRVEGEGEGGGFIPEGAFPTGELLVVGVVVLEAAVAAVVVVVVVVVVVGGDGRAPTFPPRRLG